MTAKIAPAARKRIQELVVRTMATLDRTGGNARRWEADLSAMSDAQFAEWIGRLRSDPDEHFYLEVLPWVSEPTLDDVEEAAKVVGVQLHQYVSFRHDGAKEDPVRSRTRVPVGYLHVRRLQQLLRKKTTYSTSVDKRSQLTGQLAGEAAVGRIADEEAYSLMTVGARKTLDEMFGPRGDNARKRLQFYQSIDRDGYVQLGGLQGDSKDQPSINYMDTLLLGAGLKSDLVEAGLLLRVTADRPPEQKK